MEKALLLREVTRPEARVAVTWAGILPYFADRNAVDILGKNDWVIAREEMRTVSGWRRLTWFYPGHLKVNYAYSIEQLRPDVILQLWMSQIEARPYLDRYYTKFELPSKLYPRRVHGLDVLNDSPHILRDKLQGFER